MCQSMVNIQFPTAEIRRGKKKKKEERRRNRMKIYMVSLFHRATIKILAWYLVPYAGICCSWMLLERWGRELCCLASIVMRLFIVWLSCLPVVQLPAVIRHFCLSIALSVALRRPHSVTLKWPPAWICLIGLCRFLVRTPQSALF